MKLEERPTVQRIRLKTVRSVPSKKELLDAEWLMVFFVPLIMGL